MHVYTSGGVQTQTDVEVTWILPVKTQPHWAVTKYYVNVFVYELGEISRSVQACLSHLNLTRYCSVALQKTTDRTKKNYLGMFSVSKFITQNVQGTIILG